MTSLVGSMMTNSFLSLLYSQSTDPNKMNFQENYILAFVILTFGNVHALAIKILFSGLIITCLEAA